MANYYADQLNANKLYQVYDTKYPRIKQYLNAEIAFVADRLRGDEHVWEIGAGYGRILRQLAPHAAQLTGIDISQGSVDFSKAYLAKFPHCEVICMDVRNISYNEQFDVVLAMQNALSSIKLPPMELIKLSLCALKPGGEVYMSTYSEKIWDHRLLWFQEQAEKGLLGELDMDKSRDNVIVCKNGFSSVSFSWDELDSLGKASGCPYTVQEVDDSCLFLILKKEK